MGYESKPEEPAVEEPVKEGEKKASGLTPEEKEDVYKDSPDNYRDGRDYWNNQ